MGAKGLWRHMEGTATAPVPYTINNGVAMLANKKMPASEDQIENKESKIIEFEKREYLACHILLIHHLNTSWIQNKRASNCQRHVEGNKG